MTRNYISRSTQHYDTVEEAMRVETEVRQGNNLPADEEYNMVRGPDHRINPNAFIWIRSAPLDKIAEFQGPTTQRAHSTEDDLLKSKCNVKVYEGDRSRHHG